jgi:hypothetical protein
MGVVIMKKSLVAVLLLSMAAAPVTAADFLTGARGGGMGFSYFLLADDPSGALYNPSALGYVKGWQTQFMYEKLTDYDYNLVDEKPYYGQFGFTYYRPNMGTFALNSIQSGSFSELTNIPTFNHVAVSYGRQVAESWSFGGSLKYLAENGFGERTAFDIDLGFSFRAPNGIVTGLAVENAARSKLSPEYLGVNEYLPRRIRAGAGYMMASEKYQGAMLVSEQIEEWGVIEKQTTSLTNIGTEWWFLQNGAFSFAARTGYTFGKATKVDTKYDYSSPTAGVSLNYRMGLNDLRLDYAWQAYPFDTNDGSSPGSHFVALTFGWGGVPSFSHHSSEPEAPKAYEPPKAPEPASIFIKPEEKEIEAPIKDQDTDFENAEFKHFNVDMEVNNVASLDFRRIVFYIRPQQVIKTVSWNLYIFKAKIKAWSEDEAGRWALARIEGKGVPPINVVWNGLDTGGEYVPAGKYYYILTAEDVKGQKYATEWFNFKLE